MQKATVIALRKKLKMDKNICLRIKIDENYTFDEGTCFIMWDDSAELMWVLGPNPRRETNDQLLIELLAFEYDRILTIGAALGKQEALDAGSNFSGLCKEESYVKYINDITNLTRLSMFTDIHDPDFDESIVKKSNYPFDKPSLPYVESEEIQELSGGGEGATNGPGPNPPFPMP